MKPRQGSQSFQVQVLHTSDSELFIIVIVERSQMYMNRIVNKF